MWWCGPATTTISFQGPTRIVSCRVCASRQRPHARLGRVFPLAHAEGAHPRQRLGRLQRMT